MVHDVPSVAVGRSVSSGIDYQRLMRLRLAVGRYGERDRMAWWNTDGLLGSLGRSVFQRGFPKTHRFARARALFAVAKARCSQVFAPPGCMTLWELPAEVEDAFETCWQSWLDDLEAWEPLFASLESPPAAGLLDGLLALDLIGPDEAVEVAELRLSAEGRAVPLRETGPPSDALLTRLAAGFARGAHGRPAVPYARLGE